MGMEIRVMNGGMKSENMSIKMDAMDNQWILKALVLFLGMEE